MLRRCTKPVAWTLNVCKESHFESPKVVETYPYEALSVTTHCLFCTSSQCQRLTSCTMPISMVMTRRLRVCWLASDGGCCMCCVL